ncbi:MAG: hypothetical protein M3Z46_00565 [Actinomycetota bacterium]|nr:hypothetical protein [Actinomycetota bacterium]
MTDPLEPEPVGGGGEPAASEPAPGLGEPSELPAAPVQPAASLPVAEPDKPVHEPLPKVFWPALLGGWAVIAVGLFGAFGKIHHFAGTVAWKDVAKWTVGLAIVHDLFVAPAVCIVGLVLSRVVPSRVRGPVQAGLIVSALVTVTAWPVYRVGVPLANNPSILPGHYGRGLLTVLAVIWFVAIALVVRALVTSRRHPVPG